MTTQIETYQLAISAADAAYYNGSGHMSDEEYDILKRKLKDLNPNDPVFSAVGSPISNMESGVKCQHTMFMGSQNNVMGPEEFDHWVRTLPDGENVKCVVSNKYDGFSLALYYVKGVLDKAVTRGDGQIGEDITKNARAFKNVPLFLENPLTLTVRGESLLYINDWKQIDPEMKSNPRNLCAGIARRKDGENSKLLHFQPFDCDCSDIKFGYYTDKLDLISRQGFDVDYDNIHTDISPSMVCYKHSEADDERKRDLPYQIDGIIVRVNDMKIYDNLGVSSNRPKGSVAWKFEPELATSTIRDVEWQIGHSGRITPVAKIDPVKVGGVTVSSITLHNMNEIKRLGVGLGDEVLVCRGGDVIPKILRVEKKNVLYYPTEIVLPNAIEGYAVSTRTTLSGVESANHYIDSNHPKVTRGRIANWINKIGIDGLGDEILDAMMNATYNYGPSKDFYGDARNIIIGTCGMLPLLDRITSLYRISDDREYNEDPRCRDAFINLIVNDRKLGRSRANKIIKNIKKSQTMGLAKFLGSLSIDGLGRRRAQLIIDASRKLGLSDRMTEIEDWVNLDGYLSFVDVPPATSENSKLIKNAAYLGIPNLAQGIQEGLNERLQEISCLLFYIGFKKMNPILPPPTDSPFIGTTACFTGCRASKEELEQFQKIGGSEKSGVSKGLTWLVMKDENSTSSKADKAKAMGVDCIGIDQFRMMIFDV